MQLQSISLLTSGMHSTIRRIPILPDPSLRLLLLLCRTLPPYPGQSPLYLVFVAQGGGFFLFSLKHVSIRESPCCPAAQGSSLCHCTQPSPETQLSYSAVFPPRMVSKESLSAPGRGAQPKSKIFQPKHLRIVQSSHRPDQVLLLTSPPPFLSDGDPLCNDVE